MVIHTTLAVLDQLPCPRVCRYKKYVGDPSELSGGVGDAGGMGMGNSSSPGNKRDSSLFRFPSDATSEASSIPITWAEPSDGDMMITAMPSSTSSTPAGPAQRRGAPRQPSGGGVGEASSMPGTVSPSSDTDVDADQEDLHTTIDRLNRQMDEQLNSFDRKAQQSLQRCVASLP